MATTTEAVLTKWFLYKQEPFESMCSSVVLVSTYCRSGLSTSVSESESTAGGVSTNDKKTATVHNKPVTSLAGNNKSQRVTWLRSNYTCIIQYSWLVQSAAVIS